MEKLRDIRFPIVEASPDELVPVFRIQRLRAGRPIILDRTHVNRILPNYRPSTSVGREAAPGCHREPYARRYRNDREILPIPLSDQHLGLKGLRCVIPDYVLNQIAMVGLGDIGRPPALDWLPGLVIEAQDQPAAALVIQRDESLCDFGSVFFLAKVQPTLEFSVEGFAGRAEQFLEICRTHWLTLWKWHFDRARDAGVC